MNKYFAVLLIIILAILICCFLFYKHEISENLGLFKNLPKDIYVKLNWGICNRLRTIRKLYAFCLENKINLHIIDNLTYNDSTRNAFPISIRQLLHNVPINIISNVNIPKDVKVLNNGSMCECSYAYLNNKFSDKVLISCCDFIHEKYDKDNQFYKLMEKYIKLPDNIVKKINEIKQKKAIGVHIRQASVFDYHHENFFGDSPEKNDEEPHHCCFVDKTKNLSYCPKKAVPIDHFIKKMNTYPKDQKFYVCSDRTGCILILVQKFQDRIISNPIYLHKKETNIMVDFYDWWCLQYCSTIITTWQSSYSREASILNNSKKISV